jgi:hypothetical protein
MLDGMVWVTRCIQEIDILLICNCQCPAEILYRL